MIRRFEKAYSTYNKLTYLYSVGHTSEEVVDYIHHILENHGSDWDWEGIERRLPFAFGSDGDVYFTSDEPYTPLVGHGKNLGYAVYYTNAENGLIDLLKNTCIKTYNLFEEVYNMLYGDVGLYFIVKSFDENGDYKYCKAYLGSAYDKNKLFDLLYDLYKPKLISFDEYEHDVNDLTYVSVCGEVPDKLKFYYKII